VTVLGDVVTIVAIAANTAIAVADFARAPFVLANSAEVGVSARWIPTLGSLKLAGAIGLAVGLAGVDEIGIAAGLGLTAFFSGAVIAHTRARVFHNIAFPLAYLSLAVGSLVAAFQR
jgi:hypothetical protein